MTSDRVRVPLSPSTFVELARLRAAKSPQQRAYTFLDFRPDLDESFVTYEQLDLRARSTAVQLRLLAQPGDRAMVFCTSGAEFIGGFLGCLYAGLVAVPVAVPRYGLRADRLHRIIADAQPSIFLCSSQVRRIIEGMDVTGEKRRWVCTDEVSGADADRWEDPRSDLEATAFLQYSSGSTGFPKGIMVSHGNLAHQSAVFQAATQATSDSCFVSWLPAFHDLGLIAGVLQPLYGGYPGALMSPEAFIEDPFRWLKAISDRGADISAAPNFAYELCLRRISSEQRNTLDLSSWRFALNGAETVRAKTIQEFSETFAACGFRRESFYPAYGLAEATLMVSGGSSRGGPNEACFSSRALEENRVSQSSEDGGRTLVSCGVPVAGQKLVITNPELRRAAGPEEVGEIWVKSPSVGKGYWMRTEETSETFDAHLAETGEGGYLRTGDLGFMYQGELFICGRLKDLILIRGRNLHASDIEITAEGAHAALRPSCGAAFSIEVDDEERLVLTHEIDRKFKPSHPGALDEVISAIRQAIVEQHEIQVYGVVLLRHGTLPKTSSGKLQRRECRARYLDHSLKIRAEWCAASIGTDSTQLKNSPRPLDPKSEEALELERWFVKAIARLAGCAVEAVDVRKLFVELGIDPTQMVEFRRTTEAQFGAFLPATLFADYPTIEDVVRYCITTGIKIPGGSSSSGNAITILKRQTAAGRITEPIALVGIGCRFPGANRPQAFWKMLCDGTDAVTEVPLERWDIDEVYDPNPLTTGKMNTRCGGFLKDIDQLDTRFFGLSIREAMRMDPQHRLMMEVAWEALEDAGIRQQLLAGSPTGVFVGISGSDYAQMQFSDASLTDAYAGLGCALTIAASRISYFFNLRGPAVAVDTACSSSLTALHLACGSLWSGECTMALAGGVNVLLSPVITMCLTKAGMMAPDGRCKAFDSRANGYVRSEGAGIVVLKALSRAIRDGDSIYAVIRGTASNQDGRSSGIAAPNGEAQQAVILAACQDAGISPGQLDYVEAHGTGTSVGDPIEVNALGSVLAIDRPTGTVCAIGSVKTNIGHAESAAGIASLIKTALILKHKQIPPSLHFITPNPLIPFDTFPIKVQTELSPLPERPRPILAGVNGFGVGGTNVHVILEEFRGSDSLREHKEADVTGRGFLLPLSARSSTSLRAIAQSWVEMLRQPQLVTAELSDVCYTAALRRTHLEHRMTVTGDSPDSLADAMATHLAQGYHPSVVEGFAAPHVVATPQVAFVFSGQGSQWLGMGRGLFKQNPVFRRVVEECDARLHPHTGWSLIEELFAEPSKSRLNDTEVVQPALFALQVGMAALWDSWGVTPAAVVGHSVGEIAAAYVAGALTMEDAIRVIAYRAKFMQQATGLGRMASVELAPAEMETALEGWSERIFIAAVNGPTSVVISGEPAAIGSMLEILDARNVVTVPLPVNYAFHSPQMDHCRAQLVMALEGLKPSEARIPIFSTVTGTKCDGTALDAHYWGRNVRQPVLFCSAIQELAKNGTQIFMEIGPHPVVAGAISRTLKSAGSRASVIPTLQRDEDEQAALLKAFGELFVQGGPGNWEAFYPEGNVYQPLPPYQFDRQRFWLDGRKTPRRKVEVHPLLGSRMATAQPVWQNKLDSNLLPFLNDFHVGTRAFLPAGFFSEIVLAAAKEVLDPLLNDICDVTFHNAADLPRDETQTILQVSASPQSGGETIFRVFTQTGDPQADVPTWQLHCSASAGARQRPSELAEKCPTIQELEILCGERMEGAEFYRKLEESGIHYGSSLQVIQQAWRTDSLALAKIRAPEQPVSGNKNYVLHPVLIEAALQACRIAYGPQGLHLELAAIQRVRVLRTPEGDFYAYARLRSVPEKGEQMSRCDVSLLDVSGETVAILEGAGFTVRHDKALPVVPTNPEEWLYQVRWLPVLRVRTPALVGQGHWLVFADSTGIGDELAERLRDKNERCVLVSHGEEFEKRSADSFVVCPRNPDDMKRLLLEAFPRPRSSCRGIVHLWSMDACAGTAKVSAETIAADQTLSVISIMHLIQALSASGFKRSPRLWTVTSGAQQAGAEGLNAASLSQATVWGLGKSIALEHPELHCCRVDLSSERTAEEVLALFEECWSNDREDQIALRGTERYVARLLPHALNPQLTVLPSGAERIAKSLAIPGNQPFRIQFETEATQHQGYIVPMSRRVPADDEVEIHVSAAGLDTKELPFTRNGAGAAPRAIVISNECAGTVVRRGRKVEGLQVGTRVVAFASDCASMYVTAKACSVVAQPDSLSDEEGATVSRPFLNSYCALLQLARLSPRERILIHGAGGDLGFAAVQVARWLGATIFATVSGAEERRILGGTGVHHILDADSLSFPSEVLSLTNGNGVEVILNCRRDWDMSLCLLALATFGRFVDASSIRSSQQVNSNPPNLFSNISFHAVDVDALQRERPEYVGQLLREIMNHFRSETFAPLPVQRFETNRIPEALAAISAVQGPAKVAIALPRVETWSGISEEHKPVLRDDATYLITGGLGALGLAIAERMVKRGARQLVLVGRRAPSAAAESTVSRLRSSGCHVLVASTDVGDEGDVRGLLAGIASSMPALRGVIHAAGVLENGLIVQLDEARFRSVTHAKISGAWHLHKLTSDLSLDFFVLFSSLASLIGSAGQGNYASANAFLDALAAHREAQGLRGVSIAWGPWAEIGMAADVHNAAHLMELGMGMLPPHKALDLLERLLEQGAGPVGAIAMNWPVWGLAYPVAGNAPFVSALMGTKDAGSHTQTAMLTAAALLDLQPEARLEWMESAIHKVVCQSLRLEAASLGKDISLSAVGLDSIVALEIKNNLESSIDVTVQTPSLLKGPSIHDLAVQFVEQMLSTDTTVAHAEKVEAAAGEEPSEAVRAGIMLDRVDQLSDAEVSSLLSKMVEEGV